MMELRIHAMHAVCGVPFVGNDERTNGIATTVAVPEVERPHERGAADLARFYDVDLSVSHECVEQNTLFRMWL